MEIEVSNGEIVDKITILQIKKDNIKDTEKLYNIDKELSYLVNILNKLGVDKNNQHFKDLYTINKSLWDVEDLLRIKESNKQFDQEFIDLARKVYFLNDKRAEIKKTININTKSNFFEEKSYEKY